MTDFLSLSDSMADEDLCRAVGEDLTSHYPDHPWMVGTADAARTRMVAISLGYPTPGGAPLGVMLRVESLTGPHGRMKAMRAGGELLERYGLRRGPATVDSLARAAGADMDVSGQVTRQ